MHVTEEERGRQPVKPRFQKFTERVRKALTAAQEEASKLNHNYVGTEHILLGLLRDRSSTAARILTNLGISSGKVRSAVEFISGRGEKISSTELGLTPRAKRVIELAIDEARQLKDNFVGTEHFLIGFMREGEGIAAGILDSLGVTLEKARAELAKLPREVS
jgi:ATP-dependent Clp protease ATP-binding subunit ClpC